jgi:hypothetical protein
VILKHAELQAIKSGDVTLAFRRWVRPTVKTGGTLKTAVGVLAIDRVARVERSEITREDATAAGFGSLSELLTGLDTRDGELYRIEVRFAGADPRLRLREKADLDAEEVGCLTKKLDRLDTAYTQGAAHHRASSAGRGRISREADRLRDRQVQDQRPQAERARPHHQPRAGL